MTEQYDLAVLQRGLASIEDNIAQLEIAIAKEKAKKEQYDNLIIVAKVLAEMNENGSTQ